jgi:hypothetical protein
MPDILELLASFGDSVTSYTTPGDFRAKVFDFERLPSKLARPLSPETNVPLIQMCYTLRSVQENNSNIRNRYSIRQTLVHHQYEPSTETAFWLTVHTHPENRDCIEHLFPDLWEGRSSDDKAWSWTACLKIHLALCEWAMEGWAWYMISLEIEYDRFAVRFFFSLFSPDTPAKHTRMSSLRNLIIRMKSANLKNMYFSGFKSEQKSLSAVYKAMRMSSPRFWHFMNAKILYEFRCFSKQIMEENSLAIYVT